jgi:hypothetical protein
MCDYSLHNTASRSARVGDRLVTTCFAGSTTRGFAAVGEPAVAVCLLPGTEVVFEQEAEFDHAFGGLLPRLRKLGSNVARFRQINLKDPHAHHDALEFPNGRVVLLTRLRPAQYATVIQLPAAQRTETAEPTGNSAIIRDQVQG